MNPVLLWASRGWPSYRSVRCYRHSRRYEVSQRYYCAGIELKRQHIRWTWCIRKIQTSLAACLLSNENNLHIQTIQVNAFALVPNAYSTSSLRPLSPSSARAFEIYLKAESTFHVVFCCNLTSPRRKPYYNGR